jgi:hypothetical protein
MDAASELHCGRGKAATPGGAYRATAAAMPALMAGRAARDSIMARNWDEWRWRRPGEGGELLSVRASRCRAESVALAVLSHAQTSTRDRACGPGLSQSIRDTASPPPSFMLGSRKHSGSRETSPVNDTGHLLVRK